MSISFCVIILDFFYLSLYLVVWSDGMVGSGFFVYSPLDMVNWFFSPPLVVQECSHLVVLDSLLSIPPLGVYKVCSCGIETGLPIVLGVPTVFPQFLQMVPQYFYVLIPLLSLQ